MYLPSNWHDVTIGQFQAVHAIISNNELNPLDQQIALLSAVSGQAEDHILSMSKADFLEALKELSFLSDITSISTKWPGYFMLKGKLYAPIRDIRKITAAQEIDLNTFMRDPDAIITNLDKILAVLVQPVDLLFKRKKYDGTKHKELSAIFRDHLSVAIAYPIAFFFSSAWQSFMLDTDRFLMDQMEKKMTNLKSEILSSVSMGG